MPMTVPMPVERRMVLKQARNSLNRKRSPVVATILAAAPLTSPETAARSIAPRISGMANRPIIIGNSGRPDVSSLLPKVKRGI
jgi:hypothetical protein